MNATEENVVPKSTAIMKCFLDGTSLALAPGSSILMSSLVPSAQSLEKDSSFLRFVEFAIAFYHARLACVEGFPIFADLDLQRPIRTWSSS